MFNLHLSIILWTSNFPGHTIVPSTEELYCWNRKRVFTLQVNKVILVDIGLDEHILQFWVSQILSTVSHHSLQVIKCDEAITIRIKQLESLTQLRLMALFLGLGHHHQELIEVDVSTPYKARDTIELSSVWIKSWSVNESYWAGIVVKILKWGHSNGYRTVNFPVVSLTLPHQVVQKWKSFLWCCLLCCEKCSNFWVCR